MTYKETLDFLFSALPMFQRIGAAAYKSDLDNTLAFDEYLSYPHTQFKSIHSRNKWQRFSMSYVVCHTSGGWIQDRALHFTPSEGFQGTDQD